MALQFRSSEFAEFSEAYDFSNVTSSSLFAQSNGQAERAVKTVKKLLKKSTDPHQAMLSYRSTPLAWCALSPAELLMGRRLRANIPILKSQLIPEWKYLEEFRNKNHRYKQQQKRNFDRHHGVRALAPIPDDTNVWITSGDRPVEGRVVHPAETPRSYIVETPSGRVRRNRVHLNPMPNDATDDATIDHTQRPSRDPIMTRTRTGTAIHPPDRL